MRPRTSFDEAHRIAFGFSPTDELDFATRLRDGVGERGTRPRRSKGERQQCAWQAAEEFGLGTSRGERKANAARGLDDPAAILKRRDAGLRTRQWPIPGLWGWRPRTVSINQ